MPSISGARSAIQRICYYNRICELKGLAPGNIRCDAGMSPASSRRTGEVRARAVANVNGKTLRRIVVENVDTMTATLHTDALPAYLGNGS
jgi:hypothetical protein